MNAMNTLKTGILIAGLVVAGNTASAQRWHRHFHRHRPVTTVVVRPSVAVRVVNRFTQSERLAMAIAYLKANPQLTVKEYAQMTYLSKAAAEAELNAFAADKSNPIIALQDGRKTVYVLKSR